jgi:NMD protein affecting ribosome stability and mRNA decay
MSGVKQCQKCGVPLAASVLHGMCPNCLVPVTFDSLAE